MIPREWLMETARRVYRSYGFSPIDTPALEYLEILRGKGGDEADKQLYHFADHGGRDVGLRFDLTVPLARFAAQHIGELGVPFKRYHIATVWRGENTQRGRYREFMQCDFDTIGTRSVAADVETGLVIHDLLMALRLESFTIHINHRGVLNGLLEQIGLAAKSVPVLRALDKLAKAGPEAVAAEMAAEAGATPEQAERVLELATIRGDHAATLAALERLVAGSETGLAGVARLRELFAAMTAAGVPAERLHLAPAVARGLDYYTGTIFETFLNDLPGIGSVCSGGRYDNLAELYTKEQLPGIGASLGLDRLLAALEELGRLERVATPAPVFLPFFDPARLGDYLRLARTLRAAGIGIEFYPEPKKLGQQLKYADRKGFRVAIIAGENEFQAGQVQIKNLASAQSQTVPLADGCEELIAALRPLLAQ